MWRRYGVLARHIKIWFPWLSETVRSLVGPACDRGVARPPSVLEEVSRLTTMVSGERETGLDTLTCISSRARTRQGLAGDWNRASGTRLFMLRASEWLNWMNEWVHLVQWVSHGDAGCGARNVTSRTRGWLAALGHLVWLGLGLPDVMRKNDKV